MDVAAPLRFCFETRQSVECADVLSASGDSRCRVTGTVQGRFAVETLRLCSNSVAFSHGFVNAKIAASYRPGPDRMPKSTTPRLAATPQGLTQIRPFRRPSSLGVVPGIAWHHFRADWFRVPTAASQALPGPARRKNIHGKCRCETTMAVSHVLSPSAFRSVDS